MGTKERYEVTAEEVAKACEAAGRGRDEVRLVAVSKTVGPDQVAEAIRGGATDFGENRPDQLVPKADEFPQVAWHFIGNIQSRRIRDIVGRASLVHSLFEERHARKIDEVAAQKGIAQDVLVEVNVSGEASKSGLRPSEVPALLDALGALEHVRVRGLMTMAPQGDLREARNAFAGLRELRDDLRANMPAERAEAFTELSMGMSEDWRVAIEEGATIVRIGRAIFA